MLRNKRQREQLVLELYEQGKTIREIANQVHMSFRDIGAIIRAADNEFGSHPKALTKDSQALELFSQEKKPIEVTVALDLKVYVVERLYKDYLRLTGLGKLASLYEEFKHCLPAFLKLYDDLASEKKISNHRRYCIEPLTRASDLFQRNIFNRLGYCLLDSAALRAYKNDSKGLFSSI